MMEKMQVVLNFIKNYWLTLAIIMSLFWGIRGGYLDFAHRRDNFILELNRTHNIYSLLNWATYQFIFNAIGSFAGWVCLYILVTRVEPAMFGKLEVTDLVLFIISFLGITGLLPQTVYTLMGSVGRLAEAVINKFLK